MPRGRRFCQMGSTLLASFEGLQAMVVVLARLVARNFCKFLMLMLTLCISNSSTGSFSAASGPILRTQIDQTLCEYSAICSILPKFGIASLSHFVCNLNPSFCISNAISPFCRNQTNVMRFITHCKPRIRDKPCSLR